MVELRHTVPVDAMRARYFHRIAAELKAKGVQLVVLIPPPRGVTMARHIWPGDPSAARFDPVREEAGYRMSLRRIAQGGSIVPDILAAMRDPRAQRLAFPGGEFFSGDFHWTPLGANFAAIATHRALARNPAYRAQIGRASCRERVCQSV